MSYQENSGMVAASQRGGTLAISEQFPEQDYNVLVPMKTVTDIAEIQKPVMNVVYISTNLDDKEIYIQEKAKSPWKDKKGNQHPGNPNRYALTKKGLAKLMRAAGIKMVSSVPEIPTTCQKCANINRSIGRAVKCGQCPNKDVKYAVTIRVPQLTGEDLEYVAHKEIIVDSVIVGMTDNQRDEFLKFRNEICESKALNRALRTAMQIKGTYILQELEKPFVVAYLAPNLDHPDVKAAAVDAMFRSQHNLFGEPKGEARRIELENDGDDSFYPVMPSDGQGYPEYPKDEPEPPYFQQDLSSSPRQPAMQTGWQETQWPAPRQGRQSQPQNTASGQACSNCGEPISARVAEYSLREFGTMLCMGCQKLERRPRG